MATWPPLLEAPDVSVDEPFGVDRWLDMPEDASGELVDGRLMEEEVPDAVHELAVAWFVRVLGAWLGSSGFVFGSELKTLTGPASGRKPDVSVFLPGRSAPPRRGPIREPADIVIEVVSPSPRDERRDRVEKMAEYAAFGVPAYWLVDPALGSFEIFTRNADGQYVKAVGATHGKVDPVPGCEGLTIDLDRLWADLSRLAED
jgi:Uma2 family endonuclease